MAPLSVSCSRPSSFLDSSSSNDGSLSAPHSPSQDSAIAGLAESLTKVLLPSGPEEEDVSINIRHSPVAPRRPLDDRPTNSNNNSDEIHLLAISNRMTELSYTISDIQTRIFEIQELRHTSQSSGGDVSGATSIIDQALMNLDARLDSVALGIKSLSPSLSPSLSQKHATLLAEWEAVQNESDVLREELKEDKWLTVFRTATEQAEGMMTSLEKAVNRCQNFIWQVHRRGPDEVVSPSGSSSSKGAINLETYTQLTNSFDAKKKHYMPATTKVLSIIDKGVQDRVTKNGECLRRHAECTQRWKNLRERISRTEHEMEGVRMLLLEPFPMGDDDLGGGNGNGTLKASAIEKAGMKINRPDSVSSTLSRSVSPIRRFAKKITNGGGGRKTPSGGRLTLQTPPPPQVMSRAPSSESALRHRHSLFPFRVQPPTPSQMTFSNSMSSSISGVSPLERSNRSSFAPDRRAADYANATLKGNGYPTTTTPVKPPWNSSVKIEPAEERARKNSSLGGGPSGGGVSSPYKRSVSRSSMGSSRPWSPVTSSISTGNSSNPSLPRPPSRATRPPSRAQTPARTRPQTPARTRPKSPSSVPKPKSVHTHGRSSTEVVFDEDQAGGGHRAFSPGLSTSTSFASQSSSRRSHTPSSLNLSLTLTTPPPRPPSRSMIPVPSLQLSTPSRPTSAMSQRYRPDSAMSAAGRAQTPESALKKRVSQIPFYTGPPPPPPPATTVRSPRPSLVQPKLPPSSFRESTGRASATGFRPPSRSGAYTPNMDGEPIHQYVPANPKDPLDREVASIVNSIPHGLLVERVDPPLRAVPKEGEEVRAQYAFTNALGRKVINCKLATMSRSGSSGSNKKVMCRVGGGWQDLQLYMLNRQAGM